MIFAHDTRWTLLAAAALVNTTRDGEEFLSSTAELTAYLDEWNTTGRRDGTAAEVDGVRAIRPPLRSVWEAAAGASRAARINELLDAAAWRPYLTSHSEMPEWHLHPNPPEAPVAERFLAECALAFVDVMRMGEEQRLRICAAQDCTAVFVDLSRNRSKRFCDTGNCGNRAHVAAYRARKRA